MMDMQTLKKLVLEQMVAQGNITQHLYKYRSDNENTEKIFSNHTLWFAHPVEFNDPFDCWVNVESIDQSVISNIISQSGLSMKDKQICELGKEALTPQSIKQDIDNVINRLGICCFGKGEKNILMWSHYSDHHKGICLQFDVLEDPDFFTFALPVNYVDQMPIYHHSSDGEEIFPNIIQPKSNYWKYEEEVRIVKTSNNIGSNKNQAFKFNPQSLKKVIFGCKATQSTIDKYKDLCKNNGLDHVSFSKLEQDSTGKFELIEKNI